MSARSYISVCSLFVEGKCFRKTCFFAHTAEQLKVGKCSFSTASSRCTNKECLFVHFQETEKKYIQRTGCTFAQGKQKIFDSKCKSVKPTAVKPMFPKSTYLSMKETTRVESWMNGECFNQDDMVAFISKCGRITWIKDSVPRDDESDVVVVL